MSQPSVFLSYSSDDWQVVDQVQKVLERNGYAVKWDKDMAAAEEWRDYIFHNIQSTARTVVLWSKNSKSNAWVQFEAALALAFQKYVPLSIDGDVLPPQFSPFQAPSIMATANFAESILAAASQEGAYALNRLRRLRAKL